MIEGMGVKTAEELINKFLDVQWGLVEIRLRTMSMAKANFHFNLIKGILKGEESKDGKLYQKKRMGGDENGKGM